MTKRRKTHDGGGGGSNSGGCLASGSGNHRHHHNNNRHLHYHHQGKNPNNSLSNANCGSNQQQYQLHQQTQLQTLQAQQDNDFIPLPIQTFLWRQTSPFVRPYLNKTNLKGSRGIDSAQLEQKDACKLFERIIITNNIWGQSPSLTDAIASIDRWRLIKVSFPFVLQCTAALLNNKLIKDNNFSRLGGNEAKMMYTLQWILMNASEECADSENEAKANASSVALAAASAAASLLKPTSAGQTCQPIGISQGSTSSTGSMTAVDIHQPPQSPLSSATNAKAHNSNQPLPSTSTLSGQISAQNNRLGSMSSCANQSIVVPSLGIAASAVAVVAASSVAGATATLQMQTTLPSSSNSVSPIGSSTPTKPLTPTFPPSCPSNYLLPMSSIQMFVYYFAPIMDGLKHSDFLTSNQRLEIGTALWEPLFDHLTPNIQCLTALVKPQAKGQNSINTGFESLNRFSDIDKNLLSTKQQQDFSASDRRRSSSMLQDQSQFGDVFLGGSSPSPAKIATALMKSSNIVEQGSLQRNKQIGDTGARTRRHGTNQSPVQPENEQFNVIDINSVTYLDIAVLRCLFINDWQEPGVLWAITFLANRLGEIRYCDENERTHLLRPRSESLSCLDSSLLQNANLKIKKYLNKERETNNQDAKSSKNKDSQSTTVFEDKTAKMNNIQQPTSRFLRVEDAETSDSGGDAPKETSKSPIRRLSFSSGMQTLANQIRKSSKRVKKSNDNQQLCDNETSENQSSINLDNRQLDSKHTISIVRSSSSADDLSSSQVSGLSVLQKNSLTNELVTMEKQITESNPVITVSKTLVHNRSISSGAKKDKYKQSSAQKGCQILTENIYSRSTKRLDSLTRSQTVPSNLHISKYQTKKDEADHTDSMGANHYIDESGRIDPIVVLKAMHSVSQRSSACSQRVCDKILNIVSKLMKIGILKENYNFYRTVSSHQKDLTNLLPTRQQHHFKLFYNETQVLRMDSEQLLNRRQQIEEAANRAALIHRILIDIVIRLYHHNGCPNNCGLDSTVDYHQGNQTKFSLNSGKNSFSFNTNEIFSRNLRMKLREILEHLCNHNKKNFISYIQSIVNERSIQHVIDFLHSILGFCKSDYLNSLSNQQQNSNQVLDHKVTSHNLCENLNAQQQKSAQGSSSSPHSELSESNAQRVTTGSSKGSSNQNDINSDMVESIIISCSFKKLITRLAILNKELKLLENTSLYCDIRRLINLIKDNFEGVFRTIVLSALIDCVRLLNQQQKLNISDASCTKRGGDFTRPPSDDESAGHNNTIISSRVEICDENHGFVENDRNNHSNRFIETSNYSPVQQSTIHDGSPSSQHRTSFGSCKHYSSNQMKNNKQLQSQSYLNQEQQHQAQTSGILSLSKAKKKLEQVFGGNRTGNKVKSPSYFGGEINSASRVANNNSDQVYNNSTDEISRRASVVGEQSMGSVQESFSKGVNGPNLPNQSPVSQLTNIQLLRQSQQMYEVVQTGMLNFSFLMESCSPGDFLEPALLAALLDLKSPIVVRAAIFLECANFVHRCNRGQWPSWMKMNIALHRGSNAGLMQSSSAGSKFRKSSSIPKTVRNNTLMYRAAGRAFYSWAEAVGSRLEELIQMEQESTKDDAIVEDTENDDNQLMSEQITLASQLAENQQNSEIDFFQTSLNNSSSPFALKMAACQLLFEVTTFLRETYRYLPPTIVHHQTVSARLGDKMTSIYDVSRAVTANRRWSMALSSLGFGQLPATLSAMSAQPNPPVAVGSHGRHPTTAAISEHPERRISFILHETNDENEQEQRKDGQDADSSSLAQAVASPIAPSVNTNEQQQDAMRKLTAGRHLSQSSASSAVVVAAATCLLRSSGVIESQTHRRKSIKLKKTTSDKDSKEKRTKFAQDLDEEIENSSISDAGIRRTDSLRSRRRVSGISEKSDTSDRANNGIQCSAQDYVQQIGELSGDESAENGSCEEGMTNEAVEKMEADDGKIMSNLPWFKAIALINQCIDCNCTHFPNCRQYCYKTHQNMCKKLINGVQSIYQADDEELNYAANIFETRLANLMNLGNQQKNQESKASNLVRAGSDCSAGALGQVDESKKKEKKFKKAQQQLESPQNEFSSPRNKKIEKSTNKMQSLMSFHLDSVVSGNGISMTMTDAVKALTAAKAKKRAKAQKNQEDPPIIKYMKANVKSLLHCPMSSFLKGAVILNRDNFIELIKFSWNLLLEDDQQLSRTAAVGFIISAIKCPSEASKLLLEELESTDASRKVAAINKFYVIWDARYQCWPRLEDGAFVHFKMAPPSIEFTLPSPKIAQESKPVVDPPWMPRKSSNVEEVTIGQDQTVQKSFVTATKTRRKQQIEIVTKALREKHDKLREDRENYNITSVPITLYAAYEPTLSNQPGSDEADGVEGDDATQQENRALLQMKTAQALFPTCLCQAAIIMINLLDDSRVTYEGSAVYEIASKVIWSCLVEDPALFLRHFFERLTRQNQSTIFQVLRRLIRFMPRLPQQAAYTLYNYLVGFIIYYIRCPVESSQKLIADTLSVLCLVVPSVYGLFLKDLKQILRKEQCDHNLLITANVPSAKKIIVHGSDSSGIPSQFPIDESTQFYHILVDSLEFFGIEKSKQNEYFLIDVRTNYMHNLHSYVRDYYSFKRSQHPQLQLINMDSDRAFDILQKQELINQFLEFGKVSMSLSIVRSSHMAVQRVLFLHEELMKLPTFPRKALETNFCLFRGPLGHQVFSMDRIHKICWVRVMARMFELTSGFFLQLGDIHLFLNAISGIFVLHCEETSVARLCLATFINATIQFKSIFSLDGFMPIMSTIVQVYSNHQNNQLLCRSIEFVCKQFYVMHRKPFLLQLFGSVASRLNTAELSQNQSSHPLSSNPSSCPRNSVLHDPSRISPSAFFRLLQSLESTFKDPIDILELVDAEKPLKAIDFCYQQDKEAIEILDIISLCVTVTAYASDSPRSTQMLIILETVVPLYMKHLQTNTTKRGGQSKQAHKDELQKIQSISVCIRTLIINCEGLTRNFNGPLPSIDFRSSSIRRTVNTTTKGSNQLRVPNNSTHSPIDAYNEEISFSGVEKGKREPTKQATIAASSHKSTKNISNDESEITRGEFIVPRDTLLSLVAEFLALSTGRLMESAKKYVDLHQKHSSYELLDVKSHLRLAEVANSLLKFASTDPTVMACRGLTRYMNEILPNTEWRQEAIRPALIMILKRLDKTFNRISKKTWVKRSTDWEGAKQLLKGAYLTFVKHPYIVHLPHLKSLISCCQNIILSDGLQITGPISTANLFHGFTSSNQANQAGLSLSQSASAVSSGHQAAERQSGNVLSVGTGHYAPGSSLSPSGSGNVHATSAPVGQQTPSFTAVTAAAALAERLAANASSSPITSQGFNSVTIRLIAMQLLQTGDSQTLESLIGNSMNTPEKLESLMLNFLYPMCIRVCSGAREAPKLRVCDIMYILNLVLNMLAPQSASSKCCSSTVNSPKAATDTSQFILSKITTTIGSTQTGATALGIVGSAAHSTVNSHQLAQHQESLKIGFLGLKILCVCFESQLASEWIRISRVIRDLALHGSNQPSAPLWDFLDFVATYRFPVFILLLPMIKCHLLQKVKRDNYGENACHYVQCQQLINNKIQGSSSAVCRSKSLLFVSLTAESRMLKEQLIAKRRSLIEGERQASSQAAQSQSSVGGGASQYLAGQLGENSQQGDHPFTAYHRLSAALASFANQSAQTRTGGSSSSQLGTSAALKGACFAAQLATSTPIGPQMSEGSIEAGKSVSIGRCEPLQGSIRLSGAKSREEARKVMNTILRRTSYPHNQILNSSDQGSSGHERKNSQPSSPTTSNRQSDFDVESGQGNQIIMDPAMLMAAALPAPRKSTVDGSGILKQLIQTIDRQNQKQKQQHVQLNPATPTTSSAPSSSTTPGFGFSSQQSGSKNTNMEMGSRNLTTNIGHKHEQGPNIEISKSDSSQ